MILLLDGEESGNWAVDWLIYVIIASVDDPDSFLSRRHKFSPYFWHQLDFGLRRKWKLSDIITHVESWQLIENWLIDTRFCQ